MPEANVDTWQQPEDNGHHAECREAHALPSNASQALLIREASTGPSHSDAPHCKRPHERVWLPTHSRGTRPYRDLRRRVLGAWLAGIIVLGGAVALIVVPFFFRTTDAPSPAPSPADVCCPVEQGKIIVRVQNANSNLVWAEAVAALFNETYANYSGRGAAVSMFQTVSAFNSTYRPTVYAPTKAQWVEMVSLQVSDCREVMIIPTGWGMWRSRAQELGWPNNTPLDQSMLAQLVREGWSSVSSALEAWGPVKLGHGLPSATTTGINTVLSILAYATDTPADEALQLDDVNSTVAFETLQAFERAVEHLGFQDIELLEQMMVERGSQPSIAAPAYLDAVATFEPTVLLFNQQYAKHMVSWNDSLVFVFVNHTIWDSHPYCLVEADWVDVDTKIVAKMFLDFLSGPEARQLMVQLGYRPIPDDYPQLFRKSLASGETPPRVTTPPNATKLTVASRPSQPANISVPVLLSNWTVPWATPENTLMPLQPSRAVQQASVKLWEQAKRPVMLCMALDISPNMLFGNKLDDIKEAAQGFLASLRDDTQYQLVTFGESAGVLAAGLLGESRGTAIAAIQRLTATVEPGSVLYAATEQCLEWINKLQVSQDDVGINRVVVSVSSGLGTDYLDRRQHVNAWISRNRQLGLVTTINGIFYGSNNGSGFDQEFFRELAGATGGHVYQNLAPGDLPSTFTNIASLF